MFVRIWMSNLDEVKTAGDEREDEAGKTLLIQGRPTPYQRGCSHGGMAHLVRSPLEAPLTVNEDVSILNKIEAMARRSLLYYLQL